MHWKQEAERFEKEFFNPYTHDWGRMIRRQIDQLASRRKAAADFGCGAGRLLPYLAKRFREVYGLDRSPRYLKTAGKRCAGEKNVHLLRMDLGKPAPGLPRVEVGVSVNAAIEPGHAERHAFLRNISDALLPGGFLALVVPSVESVLYTAFRHIQWNLQEGLSHRAALADANAADALSPASIRDGVIKNADARQKHYLREELLVTLRDLGLEVKELEKVQYPWDTEFIHPPGWMKEPYPWDWFVLAQKV